MTPDSVGLYTSIYILLLPYALFRWGAGARSCSGLPIMLATYALGIAADYTTVGEAIGGIVFALSPAVLGAAVRFQVTYRGRQQEQVKLRERGSSPASCTTRWLTTSRRSSSAPRPAASSPPPIPMLRWTHCA